MIPIKIILSFFIAYCLYELHQHFKASFRLKILSSIRVAMTKCILLLGVYDYMKPSDCCDREIADKIRIDFIGLSGLEYTRQAKELTDAFEHMNRSSNFNPSMAAMLPYKERADALNYITNNVLLLLFENDSLSVERFIADFESLSRSEIHNSQLTMEIGTLFKKHKEDVIHGREE